MHSSYDIFGAQGATSCDKIANEMERAVSTEFLSLVSRIIKDIVSFFPREPLHFTRQAFREEDSR
jgi:hypothetical protein